MVMKILKIGFLTLAMALWFSTARGAEKKETKIELSIESSITKAGFVGEALEYVVTLRSNVPNIADVKVAKAPQFPESVKVIKGVVRNQRPKEEVVKGETVYTWTILRDFIIPTEAGKLTISGAKYVAFVAKEKIVNDFFWGARRVVDYEEMQAESKAVTFKVDKLPEKNLPENFSGCVGDFSIEGWFPPGEIIIGREAIVVFTISGYGSLENLKLPNIAGIFNNGCSLREIEQNEELSQKDGRLFSEVTLTCRFTPNTEDGSIAPLKIGFFNPEKKSYETVESFTLHWDKAGRKKSSGKVEAIEI